MIAVLLVWLFGDLVCDHETPGRLNDKKAGMFVASVTFTAYMVVAWPNDWQMWATYCAFVGGWNVGSYAVKKFSASKVVAP